MTILLCSGTLWVRKSDRPQQDGLSRFLIWEDMVAGLTQKLSLDETIDQKTDTQPFHMVYIFF